MQALGLMTINMFMIAFYMFQMDCTHDTEGLRDNYEEILDMAADAGFTAVDVTSWELDYLGRDYVAGELAKRGLKVSSLILLESYASFEGVENRVQKSIAYAVTAKDLGTDVLMLAPQTPDNIEAMTKNEIHENLLRHFAPITEQAVKMGLHTVVEDSPGLGLELCRAEDLMKILDAVPGLELVYDSGNMLLVGEDPVAYLKKFEGRIGYVHIKDMRQAPKGAIMSDAAYDGSRMSAAPTGTGLVDIKAVLAELNRQGYTGGVTVEFFVDDDRNFVKSLIRVREYMENLIG